MVSLVLLVIARTARIGCGLTDRQTDTHTHTHTHTHRTTTVTLAAHAHRGLMKSTKVQTLCTVALHAKTACTEDARLKYCWLHLEIVRR